MDELEVSRKCGGGGGGGGNSNAKAGRRDSLSVLEKLQEKVAGVGRRFSLGPGDAAAHHKSRRISPRRPRKGSIVSIMSNALSQQIHTSVIGAVPLVATSSQAHTGTKLGGGADMGNKATSQSQSEEEAEAAPRVPPLSAHTPASGRSSSAIENGDDGDLEVELPSIPKMEIFSHPMAAAGGPKAAPSTLGTTRDSSSNQRQSAEQHESSEWDRHEEGFPGADSSSSSFASSLFHNPACGDDDPPASPLPAESSPSKADSETKEERELRRREFVIRELIETEISYVSDLKVIVEGFMHEMRSPDAEAKMPEDLKDGKDKIVFGNLEAIYEWHRDHFLRNIEDFLEHPENIGPVFQRSEKKFQMYVKYCQNKPKSEYIVSEYFDYFEELRQKLDHKLQLPDLLIKPIQRLMKYQLMLREILKHTERAGLKPQVESMRKAVHIMTVVPKSADDMMNVGRLQGFAGKIMAQGKLLLYGPLLCSEGEILANFKGKELIVFLFEQSIIFSESEGKKKQFTNQQYIFKSYLQMNKMQLIEKIDPSDPLKFLLKSTDPHAGKSDIAFICQGANQKDRDEWVSLIRHLLQAQKDFLKAIQSPIAYQKEQTRNGHTWLTRIESGILDGYTNEEGKPVNKLEPSLSHDSHSVEPPIVIDQAMDNFRRQSDPTFDNKKKHGDFSLSPTKNRRPFFRLPLKPRSRTDRRHSVDTESGVENAIYANSSIVKSLSNAERNVKTGDDRVSIEAGMNVKVLVDFTAVREDEISVYRGEVIQVISCNQVRGFLVYRSATSLCPAAEGWVPSHVLLPPAIPHFASSPTQNSTPKKSWMKLRKPSFSPSDNIQAGKEAISLPPEDFSLSASTPPYQKRAVALINPYNPEPFHGGSNLHSGGSNSPSHPNPRYIVPDSPDAPVKFTSPLNNVTVSPGKPVVMSCLVNGQGVLAETINVSWFGPRGELSDPRFEMEQHRDGTFQLHFSSARIDDAGEYTCVISTGGYSVSCSAILRIVNNNS